MKSYPTYNPATGEEIGQVPAILLAEVSERIARVAKAQRGWAALPRWRRSEALEGCARALEGRERELAIGLSRESGKVITQARGEVLSAARLFRAYGARLALLKWEGYHLDQQAGFENDLMLRFQEPLGVVAAIVPFNFPVSLLAHKVAPALAMGNAAVVKPSESTGLITEQVVALLRESLAEHAGVLDCMSGGVEIGEALVEDAGISAISFTGSTAVGEAILRQAAHRHKRVLTELGGNDAMIVCADADLDVAAKEAFVSRLAANGQCCCATKRILVDARCVEAFRVKLRAHLDGVVMGDPLQEKTHLGPLISRQARQRLDTQLCQLREEGWAFPAWESSESSAFAPPLLLADVPASSAVAQDLEIFAPVYPIISFETEAEALEIANASAYGLSGSVFSRDLEKALYLARMMQSGQVVINRSGLYRPDVLPFGGIKASGNSREGLDDALLEFSQVKAISMPGLMRTHEC